MAQRPLANNPALWAPATEQTSASEKTQLDEQSVSTQQVEEFSLDKLPLGSDAEEALGGAREEARAEAARDDEAKSRREDAWFSKNNRGWRFHVRHFSPSWFVVTMGTGAVALLFISIPYPARWLYWLSVIFFCLNTLLFFLGLAVSIVRYAVWPEIWGSMLENYNNSVFLAAIPISFSTLVEMWVAVCVPAWGPWAKIFAWATWMVDLVFSILITIYLCFARISKPRDTPLSSLTALQLIPIASTIVAAATGAEVAGILNSPTQAFGTLVTSYIALGGALGLAFTILVIYYQRLIVYKLPPREAIVSSFLPVGPLALGAFSVVTLGNAAQHILPATQTGPPIAGDVAFVTGILLGLPLWGFSSIWLGFAIAAIAKAAPIPFNMGWWGFTFPLGVYAISTIVLGQSIPSEGFKVLGTIASVAVILLWLLVSAGTIRAVYKDELGNMAPGVDKLKKEDEGNIIVRIKRRIRPVKA